jgi:hypothetical protein
MATKPRPLHTWCMWGKSHPVSDPAERTPGDYCRTHQQRADAIGQRSADRARTRQAAAAAERAAQASRRRSQADREAFALNALIRAAEQCEHCAAAVHAYRVARGY